MRDKLEARLNRQRESLPAFKRLADRGNKYAEGFVEALEDEIRWLKWILGVD